MATLVLNRDSLSVKLESDHLVVRDHAGAADGRFLRRVPLVDVDRVTVVGRPAISFHVLARLMDKRIPCSFLTRSGRWRGAMDGDCGFHAARRKWQYVRADDPAFVLPLARETVTAKLRNCRRVLQRLAGGRDDLSATEDCRALSSSAESVTKCRSLDSIRGIEGGASARYFRALARLMPKTFHFASRTRRPPRDPANALLSFVYTLLASTFDAELRAHGLDPSCGYLHVDKERSPSLALDLMEPFRPACADLLVLNLMSHRRIAAERHFEPPDEEGGVHLTAEGREIVFAAYDAAMERECRPGGGEEAISMRRAIEAQVCRYIGAVENGAPCEFYRLP